MISIPVLAVSFIMTIVAVLFVICCVALILIVLIQKGKGGGLSAAFGGAMASGILGSKTGDFLTWLTIALVGAFLLLAVVMAKFYRPSTLIDDETTTPVQQSLTSTEQPVPSTEQPVPTAEQPVPAAETGDQTSDANDGVDINSPGE